MPKTPHMYTVTDLVRRKVADEMTKQTPYTITPDMVSYVKGEPRMNVYAAQFGDVTVLCWFMPKGKCFVKSVCW